MKPVCLARTLQIFWLVSLASLLGDTNSALAQNNIVPDDTLGNESSVVNVRDETSDKIDGGATRGSNLFHSFQEFNVGEGRGVYFSNPNGINNVFSRVTGSNVSNILGTLGVDGAANLYLINPNGIIFGANSSLDVQGSFTATTTHGVRFGEQGSFDAINPQAPQLLTVNPSAYFFNQLENQNINGIQSQGTLGVSEGNNLTFLGGDIELTGSTLIAPGGKIELGSLNGTEEVDLVEVADGFTVDYSTVETFGDISLSGNSVIDASGLGGGNIQVAGKNISLQDFSTIEANTMGGESGGNIDIFASDSLTISGVENEDNLISGIYNRVLPNATADGGDINIETGNLTLRDRAEIATSTFGQGNAGKISINASDSVSLDSQEFRSQIASNVNSEAVGNGGDITITTPALTLGDGVSINSGTSGQGNGGNITINASDSISLVSRGNITDISSPTNAGAVGNGGEIKINTRLLNVTNQSYFDVSAFGGQGNAGNITINASEAVHFDKQDAFGANGIFANVYPSSIGNGGNIEIHTGSLTLQNGTIFFANNFGQGNGGNITINAEDEVSLVGNSLFTYVSSRNISGDAGNIEINTGSLTLDNGATLSGYTDSQGNGGNVIISATDSVSLNNSSNIDVKASNLIDLEGNAGNIEINTSSLSIDNGAELLANTLDTQTAKGGNIAINATEDVSLNNGSAILVSGSEGGSIDITTKNLTVLSDSILVGGIAQGSSFAEAQSGDIAIDLTKDLVLDSSDGELVTLIANASFGMGNAGNIDINARNITFRNGANIFSPNVGEGNLGKISLNATGDIIFDGIKGAQSSGVNNLLAPGATGSIEEINITAQNLTLTNGARIISVVGSTANSGNINLNVADTISISGFGLDETGDTLEEVPSSIFSNVASDGLGNSGNINIETQNLSVSGTGSIDTEISGQGNAGNITIKATDLVLFDASSVTSEVNQEAEGNGGNISIATNSLSLTNGAIFSSSTSGVGDAGSITINANNSVIFDGKNSNGSIPSGAASGVNQGAEGNGGDISIITNSLSVTNGAEISPTTLGQGNSGNIFIATDSLSLSNEGILFAVTFGQGKGGDIVVNANSLKLDNGGFISSQSSTNFDAGDITLNIANSLQSQDSFIATQSVESTGGDLTIIAKDIELKGNSNINTSVNSGVGGGGKIRLTADSIIAFDDSDIFAFAADGQGGNINLDTPAFFAENFTLNSLTSNPNNLDGNNRVDINATGAVSGFVSIPDVSFIQNSLTEISNNAIDTDKLVANSCVVPNRQQKGTFIITGNGGLATTPDDESIAPYSTGEVETIESDNSSNNVNNWQPGDPIIEPQGVYRLSNGKFILSRECPTSK